MNPIAKFMPVARAIADLSKDPSTKVGAVILDASRRIRAVGYNGFPRGVHDAEERYADKGLKNMLVAHAEANAIANAAAVGTPLHGCTLVVTKFPCQDCAKLIINAGITRVYSVAIDHRSDWVSSNMVAWTLFQEAGVTVEFEGVENGLG